MGANYSHTQRGVITLTPDIYNADHQNHIDNAVPALFDDYSASVAQMRLMTSPGGVGSESLPTSLAGEIERLRYIIKQITGNTYWYEAPSFALKPNSSNRANFSGSTGQVFTAIPSGVKRLSIDVSSIQSASASSFALYLGSGGSLTASGYGGGNATIFSGSQTIAANTAAFWLATNLSSNIPLTGRIDLTLANAATNSWVMSSSLAGASPAQVVSIGSGLITLPGALERIHLQTGNGVSTFNGGSWGFLYD